MDRPAAIIAVMALPSFSHKQYSRPLAGITSRIGVGCQSFISPSSTSYVRDEGYDGVTLILLDYCTTSHGKEPNLRVSFSSHLR
jgi:hypothetical protein